MAVASATSRPARRPVLPVRALFVGLLAGMVVGALLSGVAGGLARLGVRVPGIGETAWAGAAALHHGALMVVGFLGTVIGIERAVAVKRPAAFVPPVLAGLSGACLLAGAPLAGAWLGALAAGASVSVSLVVMRRQAAAHTALLGLGALAWLGGSVLFASNVAAGAVVPLWLSFLVLTIAAERLEMARLMRRRPGSDALLVAAIGLMLAGAVASGWVMVDGGLVYGAGLVLLAVWLIVFDIARRTVRVPGLSRYMAVCLLAGYAWLAVAGVAWMAVALGAPWRDASLHALALGFVFSMVMAHAPVILPAVARVKVAYSPVFYLPVALLHGSLAVRLAAGASDPVLRAVGGLWNAVAIAAFAAVVAGAAVAWRRMHRRPRMLNARR